MQRGAVPSVLGVCGVSVKGLGAQVSSMETGLDEEVLQMVAGTSKLCQATRDNDFFFEFQRAEWFHLPLSYKIESSEFARLQAWLSKNKIVAPLGFPRCM